MRVASFILVLASLAISSPSLLADEPAGSLPDVLRQLDGRVLPAEQTDGALGKKFREQILAANAASSEAWSKIQTKADWECFRAAKLTALRSSLHLPDPRPAVKIHVTGELAGEGYKIQKLIYETRPGWFVTANLYLPETPRDSMPGILLSHSHHSPKTQGELQDMGATWARGGCAVLVPDHLGHGERREHPFGSSQDFDKDFPLSRQDYQFRYDNSLQLYLAGESLMGWMVHDLMGGVDVLLAQPNVDAQKLALLGAVAGGGDPAAVTGAVDERIAVVAPFNFGGPQPETRYPLPDDAETSFNYAGSGSWESTRNLADSVRDGFLPWVIVGSIAPRKLIYGHEFAWDGKRDPVWRRFERIWNWYEAGDSLGVAHGRGSLRGNSPEDSHCGNIGEYHRRMMHPLFSRWLGIRVTTDDEYSQRHDPQTLACWNDEWRAKLSPRPLRDLLREQSVQRDPVAAAGLAAPESGTVAASSESDEHQPSPPALLNSKLISETNLDEVVVQRIQINELTTALLLLPSQVNRPPVVIGVAQAGKQAFLRERAEVIAKLLDADVAVCLVDVQGAGETAPSNDLGQNSPLTAHAATALMLGTPLFELQRADLRATLQFLRKSQRVNASCLGLWGESFVPALASDADFNYPRRVDRPAESSPLGALLVLAVANEDPSRVKTVYAHGGIVSYRSVLETPFVQVPHAVIVPSRLRHGDLDDLLAGLAPLPVRLVGLVDGTHRSCSGEQLAREYPLAQAAHREAESPFVAQPGPTSPAAWLLEQIGICRSSE